MKALLLLLVVALAACASQPQEPKTTQELWRDAENACVDLAIVRGNFSGMLACQQYFEIERERRERIARQQLGR